MTFYLRGDRFRINRKDSPTKCQTRRKTSRPLDVDCILNLNALVCCKNFFFSFLLNTMCTSLQIRPHLLCAFDVYDRERKTSAHCSLPVYYLILFFLRSFNGHWTIFSSVSIQTTNFTCAFRSSLLIAMMCVQIFFLFEKKQKKNYILMVPQ